MPLSSSTLRGPARCAGIAVARSDSVFAGTASCQVKPRPPSASRATCIAPLIEQPFLSFKDRRDYVLAPGGSFEDPTMPGWSLETGAGRGRRQRARSTSAALDDRTTRSFCHAGASATSSDDVRRPQLADDALRRGPARRQGRRARRRGSLPRRRREEGDLAQVQDSQGQAPSKAGTRPRTSRCPPTAAASSPADARWRCGSPTTPPRASGRSTTSTSTRTAASPTDTAAGLELEARHQAGLFPSAHPPGRAGILGGQCRRRTWRGRAADLRGL